MRVLIITLLLAGLHFNITCANIVPVELSCEYMKYKPLIDIQQPRLAWINIAGEGERGQKQTAWQIRVASSEKNLSNPDLWDSEKTKSSTSTGIRYNGKKLNSRQECWWQVRVWDKNNKVSEWSEPFMWQIGMLQPADWKAKWIGAPWQGEEALDRPTNPGAFPEKLPPPAPLFRKDFAVSGNIEKATAYVTGLGYFELYLNGEKAGEDVLVPNQTNYGFRPDLINAPIPLEDNFRKYKVMYLAYDVKDLLKEGDNIAGSIIGNGFYNPAKFWAEGYGTPRFMIQLHITYTDGREDIIVSDESWKTSKSPILMDMVYYGEHYDARLEQDGWNSTGFDDSSWQNAVKRKAPEGELVAHTAYPDRIMERLAPVSIERTGDNKYLVDFGVEISGWLLLENINGPAGHKIEINYINDGNTYSGDNSYIFRGSKSESYAARFNWFVFSAVEIVNWPGELKAEMLKAEAVNTYIEETAEFKTSSQLLNDINEIWKRSQLDNMHGGLASDCPHRERSGYTGDGQATCETVMFNYDARSFYRKWIQDMLEAQNPETGYVPNGAPWQPGCGGGVAWGAAISLMPWDFYLQYGDIDMLEENFEGMKGYIRYMTDWVDEEGIMYSQRTGKDGKVLKWFNLGEWAAPGEKVPDDMVHTFYYWLCAELTSQTASVLNNNEDAKKYKDLATKTWIAFHKKYYDSENGTYGDGGGNIFALKMKVPEERYDKVINSLKKDIEANKGHLDTGIFGTRYFFDVLSENGMHELAYEAMTKQTQPSYGFWLTDGATTSREHWNGSGSRNHPMFGGGLSWLYKNLAGININPSHPGYQHIIFKPQIVNDLDYVSYKNNTILGEAGISWKKGTDKTDIDIIVPVGSTATVYIPSDDTANISESNTSIKKSKDVKISRVEDGNTVIEVGSGNYSFKVAK